MAAASGGRSTAIGAAGRGRRATVGTAAGRSRSAVPHRTATRTTSPTRTTRITRTTRPTRTTRITRPAGAAAEAATASTAAAHGRAVAATTASAADATAATASAASLGQCRRETQGQAHHHQCNQILGFHIITPFLFVFFAFVICCKNRKKLRGNFPGVKIFFPKGLFYPTLQPGVTMSLGVRSTRRPSLSSALSIMPWLSTPLSLRGGKLAMKHTCLPTRACGSG